jgi:hypothetical protein
MKDIIKKLLHEAIDTSKYLKGDNIVYHAGDTRITKLDPSYIKGGARAIYGWGIYFTESIYKALDYGGEITYLDISNLNILDTRDAVDEDFINKITNLAKNTKSFAAEMFYGNIANHLKEQMGKDIDTARKNISDKHRWDISEDWSKMLVNLGYDVMKNGYEYVVINFDNANKSLINPDEKNNINESVTKKSVIDFILDFNYLLSLNLAMVKNQAKDEKSKLALIQMQQKFKTPVINGKTFFELADERITPRKDLFNPKFLSAYLTQIRNYLIYIKEHINRFVVDGIYKTGWLDRISRLETEYKNIIGANTITEEDNCELTEKCWKGYTQKGMKTMFGKRYPNCVKKTK